MQNENSDKKYDVLLLFSGGIDSTALIDFYLRKHNKVNCIHFQYGQPNSLSEKKAVQDITSYYKVDKEIIELNLNMLKRKDEIIGRNALFVILVMSQQICKRIALGIHSDSSFYDCSQSFLYDCQRIIDGYYSGVIRVEAPFINLTKKEIIDYSKKNDVPINLTYSCLYNNYIPCGKCPACIERSKYYGY